LRVEFPDPLVQVVKLFLERGRLLRELNRPDLPSAASAAVRASSRRHGEPRSTGGAPHV